jgi:hypothetical protein
VSLLTLGQQICIDVSRFRFLAKQMLYSFFHKTKSIELQVAFVIQTNVTPDEKLVRAS